MKSAPKTIERVLETDGPFILGNAARDFDRIFCGQSIKLGCHEPAGTFAPTAFQVSAATTARPLAASLVQDKLGFGRAGSNSERLFRC